jgi:glycosyltransferase involved in cell wall biosynthesis
MKSRFELPKEVEVLLEDRGKNFFQIDDIEFEKAQNDLMNIRGDQSLPPEITVCIVAFNEENNLYATVKSIVKQEINARVEVILVDNNSTDNTALIARSCGIKVFSERNPGVAYARQKGLESAKGKLYVSVDADTLYPSTWLQELVSPILLDVNVSVTYSLHSLIDENQNYSKLLHVYQYAKLLLVYLRSFKRGQLNCGGASMAFRTQDALILGGYKTSLKRGSDGYIALRLSPLGSVCMVQTKSAFVYTSNRRMLQDGSVLNAFLIRLKYSLKHMLSFLSYQKVPTS